jgi:competence protein ComFB
MKVHNMMEDLVFNRVMEIFDEKAETGFPLSGCYQCRLDVACYVLNRIKPEYLISGRGLAHYETEYQVHVQKNADIVALINEGIRKIETRQRPYYRQPSHETDDTISRGPVFNFPAIIGRILHGTTFEPMKDIHVALLQNGKPAQMIDYTWQNPYFVVESTRGNFTFLPRPVRAEKAAEKRDFPFEVRVEADGYTSIQHHIELSLNAEAEVKQNFSMHHTHKIGELYLFPEDQPMEINE